MKAVIVVCFFVCCSMYCCSYYLVLERKCLSSFRKSRKCRCGI